MQLGEGPVSYTHRHINSDGSVYIDYMERFN